MSGHDLLLHPRTGLMQSSHKLGRHVIVGTSSVKVSGVNKSNVHMPCYIHCASQAQAVKVGIQEEFVRNTVEKECIVSASIYVKLHNS